MKPVTREGTAPHGRAGQYGNQDRECLLRRTCFIPDSKLVSGRSKLVAEKCTGRFLHYALADSATTVYWKMVSREGVEPSTG